MTFKLSLRCNMFWTNALKKQNTRKDNRVFIRIERLNLRGLCAFLRCSVSKHSSGLKDTILRSTRKREQKFPASKMPLVMFFAGAHQVPILLQSKSLCKKQFHRVLSIRRPLAVKGVIHLVISVQYQPRQNKLSAEEVRWMTRPFKKSSSLLSAHYAGGSCVGHCCAVFHKVTLQIYSSFKEQIEQTVGVNRNRKLNETSD